MSEQEYVCGVLSPTDAAYIAGIIDGEGNISLHMYDGKGRTTKVLRPRVGVTNTSLELLEWLRKVIGFGYIDRHKESSEHKDTWRYGLYSVNDIRRLLEDILPYLVVKREQAELLLTFCKEHVSYRPATEVEIEIYYDLKELNRKGR